MTGRCFVPFFFDNFVSIMIFLLRYAIPSFLSIPEKVERATQNLIIPPTTTGKPTLAITYFSAALIPLALPPIIAKGFGWPAWGFGMEGVNSRLGAWLLDKLAGGPTDATDAEQGKALGAEKPSSPVLSVEAEEPRIRGWTFLDYYSESKVGNIVPLLVECNFRGRKEGEEGW
jgi:1-phosphatidylinositol phosphodiesterase